MNVKKVEAAANAIVRHVESHPNEPNLRASCLAIAKRFNVPVAQIRVFAKRQKARANAKVVSAALSGCHQDAINSLLGISMEIDELLSVPIKSVPELFQTAIDNAKDSLNPRFGEIAILEHALRIFERNGGDATIRTPDLVDFYDALAWSLDAEEKLRVIYSPKNATIQ
jgi:hypothetical protein